MSVHAFEPRHGPPVGLTLDPLPGEDEPPAHTESEPAPAERPAQAAVLAATPDDAQLASWVAAIIEREEAALTALYDGTSRRVYALVLRITQDMHLAEEVVEDTYWQVWRQAPRFDASRGCVLAWLLAMARSRAIDALRRDQRFRHEHLADDEASADAAGPSVPMPQDLLDATRGEHRLHQALARLDPGPRQLVALAFFRGLTHEEIAAQAGLPLGTVKSQIRRALAALKDSLQRADAGLHVVPAHPAPNPRKTSS